MTETSDWPDGVVDIISFTMRCPQCDGEFPNPASPNDSHLLFPNVHRIIPGALVLCHNCGISYRIPKPLNSS
jgi:hypothetical protein